MKPEQIHDALNLLDEDLIEAVEQLRDKADLECESEDARQKIFGENERRISWMKYMSLAACLCVVILGAFAWQQIRQNFPGNDKVDGAGNPYGNDEDFDGMLEGSGLTGSQGDGLDGDVAEGENGGNNDGATADLPDDGATDTNISVGEVPSVLVRIETWTENGFEGVVAGLVDTDIFDVGADIQVFFDDNIGVCIPIVGGMTFEAGAPDRKDFPEGSVVRVQFVKCEQASEGTGDATGHAWTVVAEMLELSDKSNE